MNDPGVWFPPRVYNNVVASNHALWGRRTLLVFGPKVARRWLIAGMMLAGVGTLPHQAMAVDVVPKGGRVVVRALRLNGNACTRHRHLDGRSGLLRSSMEQLSSVVWQQGNGWAAGYSVVRVSRRHWLAVNPSGTTTSFKMLSGSGAGQQHAGTITALPWLSGEAFAQIEQRVSDAHPSHSDRRVQMRQELLGDARQKQGLDDRLLAYFAADMASF